MQFDMNEAVEKVYSAVIEKGDFSYQVLRSHVGALKAPEELKGVIATMVGLKIHQHRTSVQTQAS